MYEVIECRDGEYLQVILKTSRPNTVAVLRETPVTYNQQWVAFTDYRNRKWDVPMSNIAGIVHKKIND